MLGSDGNAVLTDQTIICEASRLLENVPVGDSFSEYLRASGQLSDLAESSYYMGQRWWPPTVAERIIHLSMLLQTLLLYEHVYVLGAELPPDVGNLRLRRVLLDHDILRTIDPGRHSESIAIELNRFLTIAREQAPAHTRDMAPADYVTQIVQLAFGASAGDPESDDSTDTPTRWRNAEKTATVEAFRRELEGTTAHWWLAERSDNLRVAPIETLSQQLMQDIGYFGSGTVIAGVSLLRTFVYWRLSAHMNLPFTPCLRRLPAYHLMLSHIRRSMQDRVYNAISASFHATIEEVYDSDRPIATYLPPALSLFLDRMRQCKDMTEAILGLREEYRELRLALAKFQRATNSDMELGQMLKARRDLAETLAELGSVSDTNGAIDQVIDIIPSVAKAVANPLDVSAYSDELVNRPADWLRSWWRRRPLRSVFVLRDQLLGLSQYADLLDDALGVQLEPADLTRLIETYQNCLHVYGGEGVLPENHSQN
jgi:hypothetical protein